MNLIKSYIYIQLSIRIHLYKLAGLFRVMSRFFAFCSLYYCNTMGTWRAREGHVIPTLCQWLRDPDIDPNIDLDSSFAFNQTSNIFYPKILHASMSDFDLPCHQAPRRRHPHLSCIKLGYQLALALSKVEVLHVAYEPLPIKQNAWAQAYKDYLQINAFPDLVVVEREGNPHALQRKATGGATSEVVRETAGWTRPDLTLGTSTSASTRPSLCGGGPPSLCGGGPSSLCGRDGRR